MTRQPSRSKTPPRTLRPRVAEVLLAACLWGLAATDTGNNLRAQGFSPPEVVQRMRVPDGLQVSLFAAEPEIRQPILVKCDERGRLWVIQYLQYPNPAGLKRVNVDRWSRTLYDRVPEPPPHGPRGADRITILTDKDRDGRAETQRDFLTGLNLCTGLEFGHGGVYVLQVPYLLFYPDRNHDDVPDADPQVLLTGFGMEDAQSLANHLTWGPDGWLYGLNGSTTTCRIRGLEFQQGVWRYHPLTDEFELFCEGGGNVFGLTFDADGDLYYSANGGLFWHALQGGYFEKSFGKHGPLHNPYAYGYLSHVAYDGVTGSPNTGGTIYLGDTFPEHIRGTFLTGNFLGHACSWWQLSPSQTTVKATRGGLLLDPQDSWFGPTDLCLGPDGAVYVSDFYDARSAHPDPDAKWDTTNGRIYKISADGTAPLGELALRERSSAELVDLLSHANHWYAQVARRLLAERRDPAVWPRLRAQACQTQNAALALQSLWTLHGSGGWDSALSLQLLDHPAPSVRAWTVRFIGDRRDADEQVAEGLVALAKRETDGRVLSQLAASAARLPALLALRIVDQVICRAPQPADARIDWPLWWAIERHALNAPEVVVAHLVKHDAWSDTTRRQLLQLLIRRYAAAGTASGYDTCDTLLSLAPEPQFATLLPPLAQGLAERARSLGTVGQGTLFQDSALPEQAVSHAASPGGDRTFQPVTNPLRATIERLWAEQPSEPLHLRLAIQCGSELAYQRLLAEVARVDLPDEKLTEYLTLLAELGRADCITHVITFVSSQRPVVIQLLALDVLYHRADAATCSILLQRYVELDPQVQHRVRDLLLSRPDAAAQFLEQIDRGTWPVADVPLSQVRVVGLHRDERLNDLVRKHWGNLQPGTAEEKLATMRRLANDLRAGSGDFARGHELFRKHCAVCHRMFGEGASVGPDLSDANRQDIEFLLTSLVDPSAVVRSQYLAQTVTTLSGVLHTGILISQDAATLTLVDAQNQLHTIRLDEIETQQASPLSLMPERLLEQLSPQELRDLFQYLGRAN